MARVALLCPELLFGSKVEGALRAAGHLVERYEAGDLARAAAPTVDVLVVDLADEALDGTALVSGMRDAGDIPSTRTLGFYSHVDTATRARARAAGFDLVVPRSRMAREGAALVARLASG